MRLIDADALLKKVERILPWSPYPSKYAQGIRYCMELMTVLIKDAPTIEPERKKGKWLGTEFDGYADGYPVYFEWQCSECGCVFEDEEPTYNFCPNCGADMRKEQK